MPNLCLRFPKGTMTGKNVFSQTAHFLPEFPVFEEGRFASDKFASCVLGENDCLYDYKSDEGSSFDTKYDFGTGFFYISFWAKFKPEWATHEKNRLMIGFEDGLVLSTDLTTDTEWHWYMLSKDDKNEFRMYVDGVAAVCKDISDKDDTGSTSRTVISAFNLTGDSFVFLGNVYKNTTGFKVAFDDLYITKGYYGDWNDVTVPTDYISYQNNPILLKNERGYLNGYSM